MRCKPIGALTALVVVLALVVPALASAHARVSPAVSLAGQLQLRPIRASQRRMPGRLGREQREHTAKTLRVLRRQQGSLCHCRHVTNFNS